MRYSPLVLILILLFLASGCRGQNIKSNKAGAAAWNNLSTGNVIKTSLNADAYQYPVIGNHGLVLLADPGEHSIKWEVTGKKIQISKEAYVDLDKIEIMTSQEKNKTD